MEKELLIMKIFDLDYKGNMIVGYFPKVIESNINFEGENNILYCDENVCLHMSEINFKGRNSLIYLGTSWHRIKITLYNDSVYHCGKFTTTPTETLNLILLEHKHCFIGESCMISYGVTVRNNDSHLIYSCDDGNRINSPQSVYIGDHVWIGQNALLLKGTQIDSGSIVGAGSVVAGKKIPHNSIWAGNPSRQTRGVFLG